VAKQIKRTKVVKRLEALGAELTRSGNHLIYQLPDGARITIAKSSGGGRGERNALAHIARWERAKREWA
jgi:predicted RNA binding protein YcfA (HicA-like mRNA interferase family)